MSEQQERPVGNEGGVEANAGVGAEPGGGNAGALPPEEVQKGKVFAILGYVLPILSLIPILMRDNAFALYHGKQALLVFLIGAVLAPVSIIPFVVCVTLPLSLVVWLFGLIAGLINVSKGVCEPLPIFGKFAEKWFAGITVNPKPGA